MILKNGLEDNLFLVKLFYRDRSYASLSKFLFMFDFGQFMQDFIYLLRYWLYPAKWFNSLML